jgi:D-tyrosyl-tRNA(Tyr) deacylase
MRALVQRVSRAHVEVAGETVSHIGPGLLVLLGVGHSDSQREVDYLVPKIAKLRIFNDAQGKMNLSLQDVGGSLLVVSQFTLYADAKGGNRPGYTGAARPEQAEALYQAFLAKARGLGLPVAAGVFAAHMAVHLVNDGPVTIWLDTDTLLARHSPS